MFETLDYLVHIAPFVQLEPVMPWIYGGLVLLALAYVRSIAIVFTGSK